MARWKAGLIGLGGVADRIHLPALRNLTDVEIYCACERDPFRKDQMQQKWDLQNCFVDVEAMLEQCNPDFVIIGTPPDTHKDICLLALQHKSHLFCEKPFVSSTTEADEVIMAAETAKCAIAVNNQYRYMNIYSRPAERLKHGDFGHLYLAQCWQQMFHPPSLETNWRAKLLQYVLFEFGTHAFDLLCFFFDAYPESVFAQLSHPIAELQSDVVAAITLTFPGQRLATLVLNRVSHAPERYLEMRLDCTEASVRISLGGVARASIDWSSALKRPVFRTSFVKGGEARLEKRGKSQVIARERHYAFDTATAIHLRKFLENLAAGQISTAPARHAKRLLQIVFGAYQSAETGSIVNFHDDLSLLPS